MLEPLVDPDLAQTIAAYVEERLAGLHVSCPARVESFDAAAQTVDCQPLIQHEYPDESGDRQVESLPVVTSVPVAFPGGAAGGLTFALAPGDVVTLVFSTRSLGVWLRGAGPNNPVDPIVDHHHDLSDAIAIPCVRRIADAISDFATDAVVIRSTNEVRLGSSAASGAVVVASALDAWAMALYSAMVPLATPGPSADPVALKPLAALAAALGVAVPPAPFASSWSAGTTKTKAE